MSRIHENSIKWLNEQLKSKYKTNNVAVEEDLKQCIYCPKLFLNSSFVIKHIFKRHAEQFLLHHKKFIDTKRTELGLVPETILVNYLKTEFSDIKSELKIVKKAVTHHTHVSDNTKSEVTCPIGCQVCHGSKANALGSKLSLNDQGDFVENVTKEDFIKLQAKVEEVSGKYKEIVSSNKEMAVLQEDRICKRLKKELLTDFERLLIHYQDGNSEWKLQLFQLKKDLNKLEQAVELNAKKIESPEVIEKVQNKIDEQIKSFYDNYGMFEERNRTPLKSTRKGSGDSSLNLNVHRSNRRKKSIYTSQSQGPNLPQRHLETSVEPQLQENFPRTNISRYRGSHLPHRHPDTSVKTNDPQLQANAPQTNISASKGPASSWRRLDTPLKTNDLQLQTSIPESNNVYPSPILKMDLDNIRKIGTHRAKVLLIKKLENFGISQETREMTTEEYETKKQLVDARKELLCQKYKNFQQVYASLDSHANELVESHINRKFQKQLRFSDSIHFAASESKDKVALEPENDVSLSPIKKINSPFMHQLEFMQDLGACGDFNDEEDSEKSNSKCGRNMAKDDSALIVANKNTKGFKFQKHCAALPQNMASGSSFAEPKRLDDPDKASHPGPSNDHLKPLEEFSELSSLESDTNLSLNEFDEP